VRLYRFAVYGSLMASLLSTSAGAQAAAPAGAAKARPDGHSGPEGLLSSFSVAGKNGPITVRAKEMEFDYRTRVLTYRGAVRVTQADVTLSSDRLRVTLDSGPSKRLKEIVAEGDVQIAQGDRRASGGRAVFDQDKRTVVLSDDAVLRDGPNEVKGERVVVYLDEERSVVEGGDERVRAVLFPPDKEGDPQKAPGPGGER
jgi:lipopolysaccharide export system protein LptA